MAPQIDLQSLIDIGLIILVTFAVAKSLFRENGSGENHRAAWKAELKDLESSLRELIGEAGAASRNLDRNLLARKRELENLLNQFEDKGTSPAAAASQTQNAADLPNESWIQESTAKQKSAAKEQRASEPVKAAAYTRAGAKRSSNTSENPLEGAGLEQLIEKADDTLSLSQQVTKEVLRQQAEKRKDLHDSPSGAAMLAQKLAEAKQENEFDPLEQETFQGTSIMDQATYRIARRLLLSGKELHIVARKVDLPVSEIRLLDRLIRNEEKRREEGEQAGGAQEAVDSAGSELLEDQIETFSVSDEALPGEGTFSPASPTVADTPDSVVPPIPAEFINEFDPSALPVAGASVRDLDNDIEREIALL